MKDLIIHDLPLFAVGYVAGFVLVRIAPWSPLATWFLLICGLILAFYDGWMLPARGMAVRLRKRVRQCIIEWAEQLRRFLAR